jgi:cyclin A
LIAAKLEDRSTPKMEDLCYISDHSFTEDRIRELEETICKHLSFRLSSVTPLHFVNEFLRASHACPNRSCQFDHLVLRNVVLYLLALTRLSYELTMAKPSLLAAAAVYLARVTVGLQEPDPVKRCTEDNAYWTKTLHYYTGYHVDDLKPVVLILHRYQTVAEKAENVKGVFSAFKISARRHASLKTAPSIESLGFPNVLCSHDEMVESLSDEMF